MKLVDCNRCGGTHDVEVREMARAFAPPEAAPVTWSQWAPCPTTGDPILISVLGAEPDRPRGTFDDALSAAFENFDALRSTDTGRSERDAFKAAARELFSVWKGRTP